MAITQSLQQKQTQTLAMTPELQQSLKMLQLSSLDLADFVQGELEKNPLLSEGDLYATENNEADAQPKMADDSDKDLTDLSKNRDLEKSNESMDYDYSQSWGEVGSGGSRNFDSDEIEFDRSLSGSKDMREELIEQFSIDVTDPQKRIIGTYMLDMLDEAGYFIGDLDEIAENFGCSYDEVEEVLKSLQKLEPVGIFARDLAECLALQLEDQNRLDPCIYILIQNLELLGTGKLDILMGICDVDKEELMDMVTEIKSLNPKPATGYNLNELTPAQPDVIVKKVDGDKFGVEVNPGALPKVLVDRTYYAEISGQIKDKEDKKYINQHLSSANFLVRALDQRAETMLKTASAIIKFQEEFFRYGIKYLKPLTLAQVAEEIEMHESTISRVTSNKYIQTPRGVFEMKFFFTSGVSNSGGEIASTSVKETIKEIVASEDKKKPLSDDGITKELKKRGIKISRRTVMKYREAMGVESSYERKNPLTYIKA